jgi:hypothetical protein
MVESAKLRLEAQKQLWVVSLVPLASYLLPLTSYSRIYHLPNVERVSMCVSLTVICE